MVKQTEQDIFRKVVEWRRDFHRHPELSRCEERTGKVIADLLQEMGIEVHTYPSHYGVCGIIQGKAPGPVIAVRADMDALSILEDNDVDYKSSVDGVMHACGHDAHMAVALGVANILAMTKDEWQGTVKIIFQPAEEMAPTGGANLLIADGALDSPKVDAIFGLHVWPDLAAGSIGICRGAMMGSSDRLTIEVHGQGAHAAEPHKGVDAISVATDIIRGLQQIVSRQVNPIENATISIGTIHGGERYNVIANKVVMEGTVRGHNEEVRAKMPVLIERMAKGIAGSYGAEATVNYGFGYPVLRNWEEPFNLVVNAAERLLGKERVQTFIHPTLGAEDFANYLIKTPGAFLWLGCQGGEEHTFPIHNSRFNIDERALETGVKVLHAVVLDALCYYNK